MSDTLFKTNSCPFCGSGSLSLLSEINPITDRISYSVQCSRCLTRGPLRPSEDDAVSWWGSRCIPFPVAVVWGYENKPKKQETMP